jgi:hypothetical protein
MLTAKLTNRTHDKVVLALPFVALVMGMLVAFSRPTMPVQLCMRHDSAFAQQQSPADIAQNPSLRLQIDPSGHLSGALVAADGHQIIADGQTLGQALASLLHATDSHAPAPSTDC